MKSHLTAFTAYMKQQYDPAARKTAVLKIPRVGSSAEYEYRIAYYPSYRYNQVPEALALDFSNAFNEACKAAQIPPWYGPAVPTLTPAVPTLTDTKDAQVKPASAKPSSAKLSGLACSKCKEFYPYAEPNQPDGKTLICWGCKQNH